jgi:hypothetical protein
MSGLLIYLLLGLISLALLLLLIAEISNKSHSKKK